MAYQLVQLIYWLSLSGWFGGVLFAAVSAPVIFRTVREANPILPTVLSVNLEQQHATLLAGTIVGNVLARLGVVQLVAIVLMSGCYIGQFFLIDMSGPNRLAAWLRIGAFLAAAAIVLVDRYVLWPRIEKHRREYLDHADEPEIANPAKDRFDRAHAIWTNLLIALLSLLTGLILFSANITPRSTLATVGS